SSSESRRVCAQRATSTGNLDNRHVCAASAHIRSAYSNSLTPPSGLGLLASPGGGEFPVGQRVARSLPERWPAVLPRGGRHFIRGSRPSTRARGGSDQAAPFYSGASARQEWTPRRDTLLCSPPCRCSAQASPGVGVILFWAWSFLRSV